MNSELVRGSKKFDISELVIAIDLVRDQTENVERTGIFVGDRDYSI